MVAEVFIFWAKSHVRIKHIIFIYSSHVNKRIPYLCPLFASVFATTEFQMGGTELCGPKWNQQLGFLGEQWQNVQGQSPILVDLMTLCLHRELHLFTLYILLLLVSQNCSFILMDFQYSVWPWGEEDEEKGRSLFYTHLSYCCFHEENAPFRTQGLFSKRPAPYHVG